MTGLLLILSLGLIWWLSGVILAQFVPVLEWLLRGHSASLRAGFWTSLGVAPLLITIVANAILFAPGLWVWPVSPHCHSLECGSHLPSLVQPQGEVLLAALAFCVLALIVLRLLWVGRCHHRQAVDLGMLSAQDTGKPYQRIEDSRPLAFTAGMLRAQIYLSRGLLERCDASTIEAVLAHERAHLRRFDNLRRDLLMLLAPKVLAGPRSALQKELSQAIELCADADAGRVLRDPLQLADALLLVARLHTAPAPQSTSTFITGYGLEERIQALTQGADHQTSGSHLLAILIGLTLVGSLTVLSVQLGHHGLEWLLQHLPV